METIFANSLGSARGPTFAGLTEYEALVRTKIEDANDYEVSYLSWGRLENWNYFYGNEPAIETEDDDGNPINKSSIVSTDVRDTIMSVLPSLVRIFLSTEYPVYYSPNNSEQQDQARCATEYAHYIIRELCDGFLILHGAFKDALTTKIGVVQAWVDNDREVTEKTYRNITMEQYQYLIFENRDIEVVDIKQGDDGMVDSVTVRFEAIKPVIRCEGVPPEEFRVSRYAKTAKTADLIGRERMVPVSDLVKRGFTVEDLQDFVSADPVIAEDRLIRNEALNDRWAQEDQVYYGQFWIRIDGDGDGVDELRYIQTLGKNYYIIGDEIASRSQLAVFQVDPRPHTLVGDCLADMAKDIQRVKTNVIRGTMDNLVEVVNPKMVINELLTNIDDALSDDVGAIIRTRGDANASVQFAQTPYVGDKTQEMLNYMDGIRANRTGITEASRGLDPEAMQSTALSGIDAIISGAQERIELIALVLANTGFKDLFAILLELIAENPNPELSYSIENQWKSFNPSTIDASMRCATNPTLGKGSDMVRLQVLQMIMEKQEAIMAKFGVARNPVVTPIEYMNTMKDMLALVNIKDTTRYFKEITPDTVAAIDNAPNEPDPATVLAKAELEKVRATVAKSIAEAKKWLNDDQFKRWKAELDDDFRRDKMEVDAAVQTATLLKDTTQQIEPQKTAKELDTPKK